MPAAFAAGRGGGDEKDGRRDDEARDLQKRDLEGEATADPEGGGQVLRRTGPSVPLRPARTWATASARRQAPISFGRAAGADAGVAAAIRHEKPSRKRTKPARASRPAMTNAALSGRRPPSKRGVVITAPDRCLEDLGGGLDLDGQLGLEVFACEVGVEPALVGECLLPARRVYERVDVGGNLAFCASSRPGAAATIRQFMTFTS